MFLKETTQILNSIFQEEVSHEKLPGEFNLKFNSREIYLFNVIEFKMFLYMYDFINSSDF
jgi:hypothetical protein